MTPSHDFNTIWPTWICFILSCLDPSSKEGNTFIDRLMVLQTGSYRDIFYYFCLITAINNYNHSILKQHIKMYIATHTWVTRYIHILAQFIIYNIVIHIKMIKKWKFSITTSEIIHSKVHLWSIMQNFSTIIVPFNIVNAYHVIEGIINIISSQWSNSIAFERIFSQIFCSLV